MSNASYRSDTILKLVLWLLGITVGLTISLVHYSFNRLEGEVKDTKKEIRELAHELHQWQIRVSPLLMGKRQ